MEYIVEAGEFNILVGNSSRDEDLKSISYTFKETLNLKNEIKLILKCSINYLLNIEWKIILLNIYLQLVMLFILIEKNKTYNAKCHLLINHKKINMKSNTNYNAALATLVTLFFFWGFIVTSSNCFHSICKSCLYLDHLEVTVN